MQKYDFGFLNLTFDNLMKFPTRNAVLRYVFFYNTPLSPKKRKRKKKQIPQSLLPKIT